MSATAWGAGGERAAGGEGGHSGAATRRRRSRCAPRQFAGKSPSLQCLYRGGAARARPRAPRPLPFEAGAEAGGEAGPGRAGRWSRSVPALAAGPPGKTPRRSPPPARPWLRSAGKKRLPRLPRRGVPHLAGPSASPPETAPRGQPRRSRPPRPPVLPRGLLSGSEPRGGPARARRLLVPAASERRHAELRDRRRDLPLADRRRPPTTEGAAPSAESEEGGEALPPPWKGTGRAGVRSQPSSCFQARSAASGGGPSRQTALLEQVQSVLQDPARGCARRPPPFCLLFR